MPFEVLNAVRALFADYPGRYWIAGGWALDLFADRVRRPHTDVDVLVLARDLDLVAATFTDPRPTLENPNTGAQRPWEPGETLTPGPDVLAFPDDLFPAPVRVMLAASDGDDWVYHRGRGTVRKPLDEITLTTADGTPYLAPELVLLFKSRSDRPKDTEDFHDVAADLDPTRRAWLHDRIAPRFPDHEWLPALT
ncbi:nucleotidyltransferase domain-containing protein [Kribbella sindirgiensis]|uniref:Amino acid transporter n=1 Tax=Kribbella sindirgiensis TaxID=1124744 RepID=A0A4R0J3N4_9ACTN|nr:amino acid transporter [Kribbella sindirgiensis]TCC39734.1 amino acid transporter [Kribbella sindirgiensis]